MTATALVAPVDSQAIRSFPSRTPSLFRVWTASFLVFFYPARISRLWLSVTPLRAAAVAVMNLLQAVLWGALLTVTIYAWDTSILHVGRRFKEGFVPGAMDEFGRLFQTVPAMLFKEMGSFDILEKCSLFAGVLCLVGAAFVLGFFLLLPFAARPGSNQPCVRHVVRTLLMATGLVHVWAPALSGLFVFFILHRVDPYFDVILGPLSVTLAFLVLWTFAALLVAVTRDYRAPADLPQPRDPTCDDCGYDLVASDAAGRCPECGRPVAASIGPNIRPVTAWEARPSLFNISAIARQLRQLVTQPRSMFLSMPTLSGQPAAHRWLLANLVLVAGTASLIAPAIFLLEFRDVGFTGNVVWSGLLLGLAWGMLALMMVGIETAGIAAFSRMKGHPVFLAAAAKVTAYSSPLMLPWVFLGGLQLLFTMYAWDHRLFHFHSIRTEQIYLASTLSAAHIGGLLWYELTVYRGIRSIQFANR